MDKLVEKALSSEETDASQLLYNIIRNFATKKGSGKKAPTNSCAHALLRCLLNEDNPKRTRRWAGILLETVVAKIPALLQYVLGLTNLLPFLGRLVTRDDEEFKLVSATIIRALVGSDTQRFSLFWPSDELSSSQIRRFPLTDASSGKEWIEDLTSFMDDSFSQAKALNRSQNRLQVNFFQAVDVHGAEAKDNDVHIMPEDGSLYMILQYNITIVKVPITSSDPFFLEIPFEKVSSVKVQTSTLAASQEPSATENVYQLLLNMETGAHNHHLCVNDGEAKTMLFTFNDITHATRVATYIDDECALRLKSRPKMSMSQPLNISQGVQASTSPEQPSEAMLPQAMEIDEIEPAPPEAVPTIAPGGPTPQRDRTRPTSGSGRTKTKPVVATPVSRRTSATGSALDESIIEGKNEPQAEQRHGDGAPIESKCTTRPAAGNLSTLLSAALSPGSEQPLFQSVRKTRNRIAPAAVDGDAIRADTAANPKTITTYAEGKLSKARERIAKKSTSARSKAVGKILTESSGAGEKRSGDEIWDILDDPAELKPSAIKHGKNKIMATTVRNGIRKGPTRSAKALANKRRVRVIESESDAEPETDQNNGNLKAPSLASIPSSSLRRSARLQAFAIKRDPAPVQPSQIHAVIDGKSLRMESPSSPMRSSPRTKRSDPSRKTGTVGRATEPVDTKRKTALAAASRRKPQQTTKPETRGKKQQSPVASRQAVELTPLDQPPQDKSLETFEAFEEAVLDFETGPSIRMKEVVVKKKPDMRSKTPEWIESKRMESPKRPISIASDSEDEDYSENDVAVEGNQKGAKHIPKSRPTKKAEKFHDKSTASLVADEEASMAEDTFATVTDSHLAVRKTQPLIEDTGPVDKRNSTPEVNSATALVDNQSARKMAIISFDRSGPRNQGVRLGPQKSYGTPVMRSDQDQAQAHEGPYTTGKLQAVKGIAFQSQPTLRLPKFVQDGNAGEPKVDKRPALDDLPGKESVKRSKTSQSMPKNDGIVDMEFYSEAAERASRRASQRSVHITDDGSPMRNDFEEEVTAMDTGFGDVEDDYLHHQRSDDGIGGLVKQDVTAPPLGNASQDWKTQADAFKGTQRRARLSHSSSPARSSSRFAMDLAQEPTDAFQNQIAEELEGGDVAEEEQISMLRPSQLRLQFTAPMSSNRKPVPMPPGMDSKVISAYAPEKEIEDAVAHNREEEKLNDPFSSSHKHEEAGQSFFMRRLATLMAEGAPNQEGIIVVEDADKTLVEDIPMEDVESSSSSDEELAVVVEEPEEEDHENAEALEWEAALQPRRRDMFEVLGRITRRLVSHLIDSETAVEDIVEDYSRDGTRIVDEFEKYFRDQQNNVEGLQVSMAKLQRLYTDTERRTIQDHNALQTDIGSSLHDWNAGRHDKMMAVQQMERMISA